MPQDFSNSVVLITSTDAKINRFGTGFAFDQDDQYTYILTCAHVIMDVGGKNSVSLRGEKVDVVALGSEDNLDDLAVLRIKLNLDIVPLKIGMTSELGRKFFSVGYQLLEKDRYILRTFNGTIGKQISLQSRWKTVRIKAWELKMFEDNDLKPGFSGSPVIDDIKFKVVGVVSHRQGVAKGIAIDIDTLEILPSWRKLEDHQKSKKNTIPHAVISSKSTDEKNENSSKDFTMFYGNKKQIGLLELEKIYQASILLADKIYIEANVSPDPRLDEESRNLVMRKLLELKEVGALKIWEPEDFYNTQTPSDSLGLQVSKDQCNILDYQTYKKIYDNLTRKSATNVSLFYKLAPKPQADPLQGVTEIVEGRRNLWNIAVASHFGADRILTDDAKTTSLQTHLSHYLRYSILEEPILEKFLDTLNIGPLAKLNIDEVDDCRKYTKLFRNEFLKKSGKAALEIEDESEITSVIAKELVSEYANQLESRTDHSSLWHQLHVPTTNILFNLLGYFSPHSIRGDLADLLLEWGVLSAKTFPLLLIVKLRDADKVHKK